MKLAIISVLSFVDIYALDTTAISIKHDFWIYNTISSIYIFFETILKYNIPCIYTIIFQSLFK